jgi:DNA-binding NarL/FixJ family response regulator
MVLIDNDVDKLLGTLEVLYEPCDLDDFPSRAISALTSVIASEVSSYNEIHPTERRVAWTIEPSEGTEFPGSTEIFAAHLEDHPLVAHYQRTGDCPALTISDFLSDRQFHQTALYQEYYRRVGTNRQLGLTLPSSPEQVVGVALNRANRDFSYHERLLARLLRPHLARAYANAIAFTALTRLAKAAGAAASDYHQAVVHLGRDGHPIYVPEEVTLMASPYLPGSQLPEKLGSWLRDQPSRQPGPGSRTGPPKRLVVPGAEANLIVRFLEGQSAWLAIFTEQPHANGKCPRLTARQKEVLALVTEGLTDKAIARRLGTSVRTVQKHLEHAFRRLGVSTRTAAARSSPSSGRPATKPKGPQAGSAAKGVPSRERFSEGALTGQLAQTPAAQAL